MSKRPHPVPGFRLAGAANGIKADGALDTALIVADQPASLAAVFTQNLVCAAPVLLSREHAASGRAQAVLINSGNANACTGEAGMAAARQSAERLAELVACPVDQVQVASTGVIGVPLPIDRLLDGLPGAVAALGGDQASAEAFGDAICTTDRFPKGASTVVDGFAISVFAKGAGMIAPNMATMLAYAITDAPVAPRDLDAIWRRVVDRSFNAVMVDGDTSTNDTALALAGGTGEPLAGEALDRFEAALLEASQRAAVQLVEDGEGARCVVELRVSGAPDDEAADRIARTIALSPLCKTAFFGADPNWGRIVAAAGRSGVVFEPNETSLRLATDEASIELFRAGQPLPFAKPEAEAMMRGPRFAFALRIGDGDGEATVWTCDLGHNYVTLNAEYTT